jgi:phospholipid/cholesterol/gamma-HCH transport system substrate-binding protein
MARKGRSRRDTGMSAFKAGLIAIVLIAVLSYFGFTKQNPFANPYELKGVFETVNNLQVRSPVRTAGVEIGKVKKVEALPEGGARVTMVLKDSALPIHRDAQLKVRQRIFLEGNFFVDLQPGSPSEPTLDSGATIPRSQTASPVQFGQVLTALQSDTREDLKTFLQEFSKGLEGKGARGFNQSIRYWTGAYRNSALANDATLGQEPTKDLQRVLKGQQKTFEALDRDEQALKGLVVNLNTTAAAFAREDVALEASVPALRDTLKVGAPALRSLNDALPSLRRLARDALPGVRSSDPTLKASLPLIVQLRRLVSRRELRGTAAVLRRYIPTLVLLNQRSVPLSEEGRQLSACTNEVLVPFFDTPIPDPEMADNGNSDQLVRYQTQRSFVGLSGESRLADGNDSWFHASSVRAAPDVRPAPPPDGGSQPPPHRPDVPCETQEKPDLNAPGAPIDSLTYTRTAGAKYVKGGPRVSPEQFRAALLKAKAEWPDVEKAIAADQLKNLKFFKEKARR